MKIEIVKVGYLKCNCYILYMDNNALIIDPGSDTDKIIKVIGNRIISGIVITHHHDDHDGGVNSLLNKYNTKVYDRYNLNEGNHTIAKFKFEVIYTPGHKEDSICLYFKEQKIMFVGDFIFKNSIGRCDLPGGNIDDMLKSLKKIKKYDKDIILYPGHGQKTTLEYEINNNPYMNTII